MQLMDQAGAGVNIFFILFNFVFCRANLLHAFKVLLTQFNY